MPGLPLLSSPSETTGLFKAVHEWQFGAKQRLVFLDARVAADSGAEGRRAGPSLRSVRAERERGHGVADSVPDDPNRRQDPRTCGSIQKPRPYSGEFYLSSCGWVALPAASETQMLSS